MKKRLLHLLYTLIKFPVLVCSTIGLFFVCVFILLISNDNDIFKVLIIGILASIIATLVIRLLDKSDESYNANLDAINEAWFILRFFRTMEKRQVII